MQSFLLADIPPFCYWSTVQVDLFYAAVLCMECFLIACFHMLGWKANEEWYDPDHGAKLKQQDRPTGMKEPLLI